ncbi:lactoferrin/transferrin family TonB-dependent receptor [Pasteurella testudinis]|uniref:lactoferrin/transferrin family TonB-dependent receptor n=1 Tax=Pasteurella testudinis TaxID=761 RepID=UPI0040597E4C
MRKKKSVSKCFKINQLSYMIAYALFGSFGVSLIAHANEELEEIQVVSKVAGESSKAQRSLTSVVKTAEQIKKEQVSDIRDLTRYDPGVAVNEQGSGASAGYSIRGVDRDRVVISVDGIPQMQHYAPQWRNLGRFSGAKNEIEFENIKSVEISQGANSVLSGSGALGGAVMFTSKGPEDVIKPGQNYGLDITNSYSSKDARWSKSIAAAGKAGGFSALLQYTRRDGHEIKSHKNTPNRTLSRMYPGEAQYEDLRAGGWNVTRPAHFPQSERCLYRSEPWDCFGTVNLAPNDVYGETRNAVDPMDYRSDSWFGKFQYEFNPSHKVGFLFEDTKQLREIENRSYARIFPRIADRAFWHNSGEPNVEYNHSFSYQTLFPRYDFIDHDHSKKRYGIFYEYTPENRNAWIDKLKIDLDKDQTTMITRHTMSRCTLRGEKPNRDCDIYEYKGPMRNIGIWEATGSNNHIDFQNWWRSRTALKETHKRARFTAQKSWEYFGIKHDIDFVAGLGRSKFDLNEIHLRKGYYQPKVTLQSTTLPIVLLTPEVDTDRLSPSNQPIHGKSYYVGISNNWQIGKYLDLMGGVRYDSHKFDSSLPHFKNTRYSKVSWAAGASLHLSEHLSLNYKSSTGFRVPNAQEMYGDDLLRSNEKEFKRPLAERQNIKQEEALNHEIGFDLHGDVGYLVVNVFRTDYKNFITERSKKVVIRPEPPFPPFRHRFSPFELGVHYIGNQKEAFSEGFNIRGMIDFHRVWSRIPAGFSGMAAYSKVRPRKMGKVSGDKSNHLETSYAMDTLQPAKTVLGLDYDAPSGKWGLGTRFTRSDAKNSKELKVIVPNLDIRGGSQSQIIRKVSKSWYTWDLMGYVEIGKHVTLRGGVYNLMNAKYTTWETLRQLGAEGVSTAEPITVSGVGYDRLTAPGRNYALSLEVKF